MRTRAHARLYWPTVAWLNERTRHHAIDLRRTVAASPQRAAAPSTGGAAARDAADPAVPEPGLADAPRVRGRDDRAAPAPGVRAGRDAVGRQADHRRGGRARGAGAPDWRPLWQLVGLELGDRRRAARCSRARRRCVESLLGDLFSNRMSVRLMEHAATLDLAQFEDPEFYDHLERARRQTVGRIGLLALLLGMAQDAAHAGLARRRARRVQRRGCCCCSRSRCCRASSARRTSRRSSYSLLFRWTPERRQLDYLRYVGRERRDGEGGADVRARPAG